MSITFHVWHIHPVTKVRKYVGSVETDQQWLEFKRQQGARREEYICNNVGPSSTTTLNVKQKTVKPTAAAASREARAEANRRERERVTARNKANAVKAEQKAKNDKEMAGIRKDAGQLLKGHKADESADLKAGINR